MKLLEFCYQAFEEYPQGKIKDFLKKQQKKLGNEEFMFNMFYGLGCRSYNQFLDYSLLAIKINAFTREYYAKFSTFITTDEKSFIDIFQKYIIEELLYDDRHDLYQNAPYGLEKIKETASEDFWDLLCEKFSKYLIECFNPEGTEDISTGFVIAED